MKYRRYLITSCLLALFLSVGVISNFVHAAPSIEHFGEIRDGVQHVNAEEAAQILELDSSIRVLDVRTGFEYRRGHIEGASNVNYYSFSFKKQLDALDKNITWLVHCKVGVRSGKTIPLMKKSGFVSIIHLDGGLDTWKDAGLPLTK